MGKIRVDSIQINDKIHIDDLRSLDMVDIDMWGEVEMEVKPNRHNMYVDSKLL